MEKLDENTFFIVIINNNNVFVQKYNTLFEKMEEKTLWKGWYFFLFFQKIILRGKNPDIMKISNAYCFIVWETYYSESIYGTIISSSLSQSNNSIILIYNGTKRYYKGKILFL